MSFEHSNTAHGQLSIGGRTLMTPATRIMDMQALWSVPVRGADQTVPYVEGQVSRRRRRTAMRVPLELLVVGRVSMAGVAAPNAYAQLDTTMLALEEAVAEPPSDDEGTAIVWTLRNGTVRSADGWVEEWMSTPHPQQMAANVVTFDLIIPAGRWTDA